MNIHIREIKSNEYNLLDDFLYKAIFILEGVEAPPREIINAPELHGQTPQLSHPRSNRLRRDGR